MDSSSETTAPDRAESRSRFFGIGRHVALAFGVIASLLAALGLIVSLKVGAMNNSVRRMLEEHREEGDARDLVQELSVLHERLSRHADPIAVLTRTDEDELRAIVAQSVSVVSELGAGGGPKDPSSEQHETAEQRLYATLNLALADLGRALGEGSPVAAAAEAAERATASARELRAMMLEEGRASSRALQQRGREVRNDVLWTTLAALGALALVLWKVQRAVVRPVEELREGARRVAGGDLAHRVSAGSNDEIGELAGEFNRMARELQAMREALEERVELRTQEFLRAARLAGLGTMAAGIAHEINNPLGSIASCAEGLERRLENGGATREEQREYLQIIAREAYRAHEITSRLLEFARTEPPEHLPFRLQDLMKEIGVLLEHKLRSRALRLDVHCDEALPPMLGSPSECKQVLLNLIHNAIDASPIGGTIRVACSGADGEARLEVEDQGPGIPAENLERVFDPFFTTKPPGKGTGLGLAIVSRIVEAHGGHIQVRNTGKGALFQVSMPIGTEVGA